MNFRRALRKGISAAIVSTIISLAVTLLVYVADGEHWGSDRSQRLLADLRSGGALGDRPAEVTTWGLVDLGSRICAAEHQAIRPVCPPRASRTDPQVLARVVKWVARASPRVIVVDIAAIDTPAEAHAFEAIVAPDLAAGTSVFVAVPTEADEWLETNDGTTIDATRLRTLMERGRGARIFYNLPLIEAPAPVSRGLLPRVRVRLDGEERLAMTLPAAAAAVVRPGSGGDFSGTERLYSFPAVEAADSALASDEARRIGGENFLYLYLPAPLPSDDATPPSADLSGGVVVIGDTRRAARDRYWTALGDLSGGEILLNEIRQYAIAEPEQAGGIGHALYKEIPFLLIGFAATCLVATLFAMPKARRIRGKGKRVARAIGGALLLSLGAAFVTGIGFFLLILLRSPSYSPPDFITPFIGIVLGSFLEGAFQLAGFAERAMESKGRAH